MQDSFGKEIRIAFETGGGKLTLASITAVCGDKIGALPEPVRRGYVFAGWFTVPDGQPGGRRITQETVVDEAIAESAVLYAHWKAADRKGKAASAGKTSLGKQKKAICWLLIAAIVLSIGLAFTNYIIDIYHYQDLDGTVYTIKKKDGVYGLYHKSGQKCDVNDDGYYLTTLGTQLSVDGDTGDYEIYAVVDTEGTEVLGYSQRVLMFKQLTYDRSSTTDDSRVIDRIEVHNAYGTMVLKRSSTSDNTFVIEGYEGTLFSTELFAQLSVGCGYTISMQRLQNPQRLEDGSIDYAEYGLAEELRAETDENGDPVLDEEGNPVMYQYTPSWYTVTTLQPDAKTGLTSYTVTLGDATVSSAGYYARYEDRDTVYILSSVNMDAAVLQPIETLVTPMIVYPMTLNSYFDVENFLLRTDIDYDALYLYMAATLVGMDPSSMDLGHPETLTEEELEQLSAAIDLIGDMEEDAFSTLYDKALKANSRVVTNFSYIDMDDRDNTLYSSIPYKMATEYMAGYLPNSNNLSTVLQDLYAMSFEGVISLGPDDEMLAAYGLDEPTYMLSFVYHDTDGADHNNRVIISSKTEDGKYYAYSDVYDMIVVFDESEAPYLEWEDIDWYEREYYQYNIAYVTSVKLEGSAVSALDKKYLGADGSITFWVDNAASDQSSGTSSSDLKVYINDSTSPVDYTLTVTKPSGTVTEETGVYNFRRFIQSMLTASIEGMADLTDEQVEAFKNTPDSDCQLKITILLDDGQGNTQNLVYRFYQYTERRSFMTLEVLKTPDSPSTPTAGQGQFYVLRTFCNKMVTDATRFIDQIEIDPDSKS